MQRVVHLLALLEEGRAVRQRVRVTHDIERKYSLICGIPEEGGYAQPLEIGIEGPDLFDKQHIEKVAQTTQKVIRAVDQGDKESLKTLVPEDLYRKNIVSAFSEMLPAKRYGIVLDIEDYKKEKILRGKQAQKNVERLRMRPSPEPEATLAYVTGFLIEMKFEERRLRLKLPISGRALDATYSDDFEPVLLDHPREIIQVHGNVTYDDSGPISISGVDEVLEVDESPIEIAMFDWNGLTLRAQEPPSFNVSFDNELQAYELTGPFGVTIYAETQPQLEMRLQEELSLLWREYALAEPESLTIAAQNLREDLLSTFKEVANGPEST